MTTLDLTAQLAPLYSALIVLLALSAAAIVAMVERRPRAHGADFFLPERLFAGEVVALVAVVAAVLAVATTIRW